MRHLGRTHGICLTWLHDEIRLGRCDLGYIDTTLQAADIFTKFFPDRKKDVWGDVRRLIGVLDPVEIPSRVGGEGHGHRTAVDRIGSQGKAQAATYPLAAYEAPLAAAACGLHEFSRWTRVSKIN